MTTDRLFYDDEFQALREMIEQGKGYKATAQLLWPALKAETAYARLKNSTRGDKEEKLSFGEIIAAMNFNGRFDPIYHACASTSHEKPNRVAVADEEARLVNVIESAAITLSKALDHLERIKEAAPRGATAPRMVA